MPSWNRRISRVLIVALICVFSLSELTADEPDKPVKILPIAGETFLLKDRPAFLILPKQNLAAKSNPWVWYAPTLPGLPGKEEIWMFEKFLNAGIAVAGIDVGESYGNPAGRELFTEFYNELITNRGLSRKPCLLARSRGGLMQYNWAAEHPDAVSCIAGIYPVCNLASWPGLEKACAAYELTAQQLAEELEKHNPISRLAPLAKHRVPIFHLHGDSDVVVPLDANSGELAKRYRELGGPVTLSVVEGQGHNMWSGWFQSQDLVDFVISHATPKESTDGR